MNDNNPTPEPRAARWIVTGRVQGVGFRWFVRQAALDCGAAGDVCNLQDGSVEVRARALPQQLERLHAALHSGPPGASIDRVAPLEADPKLMFSGFDVRFP